MVPYTTVYFSLSFLLSCWAETEPQGHGRGRGLSWSLFHAVGERFRVESHWEWQWSSGFILSWEAQRMTYDNKGYCREKEELKPLVWIFLLIYFPQHIDTVKHISYSNAQMHSWTFRITLTLQSQKIYTDKSKKKNEENVSFLAFVVEMMRLGMSEQHFPSFPFPLKHLLSSLLCSCRTWLTGDPCHPVASWTVILPFNLFLSSFKCRGGNPQYQIQFLFCFHWPSWIL